MNDDETLDFDEWTNADEKFALRVSGNSMIEAHIADGDYVVIQRSSKATNGQIVALRDDDGEMTLKRYFNEGHRIRLEPANRAMRSIWRESVDIIGVLVGVVRKY